MKIHTKVYYDELFWDFYAFAWKIGDFQRKIAPNIVLKYLDLQPVVLEDLVNYKLRTTANINFRGYLAPVHGRIMLKF